MAQQYHPRRGQTPPAKKRKASGASPNRSSRQIPGWLWLAAGVGVGVLVSFLVGLSHLPSAGAPAQTAVRQPPPKPAAPPPPVTPAKPATRFDFYTLLPEREVIVPNERDAIAPKPATDGAGKPAAAAAPQEQLVLQAGSFRSPQEADRRRAQLLLLGLEARVESVVANGDTWYRVHAGRFPSREKVTTARDQLSKEGIETLLLKQKPAG
jgi:cell division protein FtsN